MYKSKTRKITYLAMSLCLSLILSYVEFLLPIPLPIPGIKLGLSNIILIFLLYSFSFLPALLVGLLRVLLSGLLFSGVTTIFYGSLGILFSVCTMALFRKIPLFSEIGVSMAGSIAFQIGQLLVACIVMKTFSMFVYLPILGICAVLTGILTGFL